jgi:hypothetical protein
MAGIEPAAATLAGRARSLAVIPAGRLPRSRFGLPSWCSRYGRVKNQACTRGLQELKPAFCRFLGTGCLSAGSSLGKRKPPRRLSLGRLPASASWRLHSNHSADQGSRKLRDRAHVPVSFLRLPCRHISMVGRLPGEGNCINRRIADPGARGTRRRSDHADRPGHAAGPPPPPGPRRLPGPRRPPGPRPEPGRRPTTGQAPGPQQVVAWKGRTMTCASFPELPVDDLCIRRWITVATCG